ncbi:MAG TPA: ABC transporter permease [Fimbriimonadaceae bacterium]|nr:ABC transporter permease [Fimbriimonadaceae bacterium]
MVSWALTLRDQTFIWSAPVALAAMGGFTSERSGIINIALEGKMLTAACVGFICSLYTPNPYLALLAAIGASTALSLFHWLLTQKYRLDHIISGMAINAIAAGATDYLYNKFAGASTSGIVLLSMKFFWAFAYSVPLLLFLYVRYTRGGLRLFAVGNDPAKSRLLGLQPLRVRLCGLLATGVFTGVAGAMLFTNAGQFTLGMTAGKGFIALAALIIGGWRPIPALLASLGFGFCQALQLQLQGTSIFGANLPAEVYSSLPYIITVVALAGFLGRGKAPAGLGKL